MSNAVFPTLAGLSWSMIKTPSWSTKVQRATSGKEYRSAFFSQPIYAITKVYDVLRADAVNAELQTLVAFFNSRQGSYDNFLLNDTTDNTVTAQSIGTGNGVATQFQLIRSFGGNNELVANVNAIVGIYDNGSPVTQGAGAGKYTIDSYGLVTFGTAPVAGHALTWSGTYYYRCRFARDQAEFENFMYQLWTLKKCELLGCLGTKI